MDVAVHAHGEPGYPSVLASDHEAPDVLFSTGDLAALDAPRVTIVGGRQCTHYGRDVSRRLGRDLAELGVCIVSGLALGIDGAAHEGATSVRGAPPVAVVGSGLDVPYPRRHARLWQEVAARGCILSEAPLGAPPAPWRFPLRNRILAALAQVLVVVESRVASGTQYTIDAAASRGIPVMAVPGPIHSQMSEGPNRLLREGCAPVLGVDDILDVLHLSHGTTAEARDRRAPPARCDERVLAAVDWTPTPVDSICRRTGQRPTEVAVALAHLEIDGWITGQGGWWTRLAPP
ncbi:MAG TPA: DNA-processing protein DprA [Acidimicrobiales bacterium]|nr:DNA-processing protein DprA [Acidimicrobiales bacterium]